MSDSVDNIGVSAREILNEVYRLFKAIPQAVEIKFATGVRSVIADDSDGHRHRTGYTQYDEAVIVSSWLVAFGTKCGAYPAAPFDSDLAIVNFCPRKNEDLNEKAGERLKTNDFFRFSALYSMADGVIAMSDLLAQKAFNQNDATNYVVKGPEYCEGFVSLNGTKITKSAVKYKKEFADFLFQGICKALKLA